MRKYSDEELNNMFDQIVFEEMAASEVAKSLGLPEPSSGLEKVPGHDAVMRELRLLIEEKIRRNVEFDEEIYRKLVPLFKWIVENSEL